MSGTDSLAKHIDDLCEKHQIAILNRSSHGGRSSKRDRTINIKPVKTQRTYIVALHEIGHIVGRGRSGTRLQQEAAACAYQLLPRMGGRPWHHRASGSDSHSARSLSALRVPL